MLKKRKRSGEEPSILKRVSLFTWIEARLGINQIIMYGTRRPQMTLRETQGAFSGDNGGTQKTKSEGAQETFSGNNNEDPQEALPDDEEDFDPRNIFE
ncbi:MAG: hypothetical protein ABIH35_01010 [Patescibacteria group bacterium]